MTLSQILNQTAASRGNRTALLFGDRHWTFLEFQDKVLRLASGLQRAGIGTGDRVLLLSKNSPEFVFTVFALSHVGAAVIPVNFYQKPEEIVYMASDSGACAIVTQSGFLQTVRETSLQCPKLKKVWLTDSTEPQEGTEPFWDLAKNEPMGKDPLSNGDSTALILYTSGTTGKPKGVMLSQSNLSANAEAVVPHLGLTPKDRFLCILPMFHVFAWTANVLVPVLLGCPITIVENIRPPKQWLELMRRDKTTIFAAIPQIYAVLAEQAKGFKKWALRWFFFRHVRFCVSGSAPLLPETLKKFEGAMGVPILQGYGLTETSPIVSVNTMSARKVGSVGRPIEGVGVKIIDEQEAVLPAGQEGEICVRGHCIMQGYNGLPEDTKSAFTRDGWFKTGDIGLLDSDGFLFIHDRIKDMIIVKGLKVFSIQIEELLLAHPAVAEAAVVGIPDKTGDETIKAFVTLKPGVSVEKTELLRFCQEKLPPYKRPRDIEIRKELPKNALQKVLKRELRKQG